MTVIDHQSNAGQMSSTERKEATSMITYLELLRQRNIHTVIYF